MDEEQIKHMVGRFLAWKLPEDFRPDGGVSFEPTYPGYGGVEMKREPSGTNLLDYKQAEAMVRHMLEGIPATPAARAKNDIIKVLEDCESYFENKSDADHDDTGFVPNREMVLLSAVKEAIAKATSSA